MQMNKKKSREFHFINMALDEKRNRKNRLKTITKIMNKKKNVLPLLVPYINPLIFIEPMNRNIIPTTANKTKLLILHIFFSKEIIRLENL